AIRARRAGFRSFGRARGRRRQRDVAIADLILVASAHAPHAAPVDRLDALDAIPRLAAERAGVHRERAADRARYAGEERRGAERPARALPCKRRARHAGAGAHARLVETLELPADLARRDHRAAAAAIAHEQIRAEPDDVHRHIGRQRGEKARERLLARRLEIKVRRPADAPRCMPPHRLVAPHAFESVDIDHHRAHFPASSGRLTDNAAGSFGASAPIEPAPSVNTTSPPSTTFSSTPAISSSSSTRIGSTLPRARTARASALPSAPTIGASPAA